MTAFTAILGAIGLVIVLVGLVVIIVCLGFMGIWIQARASGVQVSMLYMWGMKLRRLDPTYMIDNMITLRKAGVDTELSTLEAHVLAGGSLGAVAEAAVSAHKAGLPITFERICAIDLAGADIAGAVGTCVSPRIVECPPAGSPAITGVAHDGVRLSAKVRITVRANLDRVVGGATDETIIARVGEGVVAAIGHAELHKELLEKPETISAFILSRGLDSGTAFEIVSVDVSDVDIIDNVGAHLAERQADADRQMAQARAEMRRAQAVARGQEMQAKIVEMTATLTANQAMIPLAMASACQEGNLWRRGNALRPIFGPRGWERCTT